jgi:hypothetical protein
MPSAARTPPLHAQRSSLRRAMQMSIGQCENKDSKESTNMKMTVSDTAVQQNELKLKTPRLLNNKENVKRASRQPAKDAVKVSKQETTTKRAYADYRHDFARFCLLRTSERRQLIADVFDKIGGCASVACINCDAPFSTVNGLANHAERCAAVQRKRVYVKGA